MLDCVVMLTSVTIGVVPKRTVCLGHEGTEDLYATIPAFDGEERLTFSAKRTKHDSVRPQHKNRESYQSGRPLVKTLLLLS